MRRSARVPISSTRYPSLDYIQVTESGEPETFGEVKAYTNQVDWMRAMLDEMKSLHYNHTYEFVALPKGKKTLKNK